MTTASTRSTTAAAAPTTADIRRQFIDFFTERHGHTFAPSSPVVPHDDPTLLFTNAGMNQFKDVFLGQGQRPYARAVNSQKCIRAGGKHNDLEDVGKDTYHHTFFEMLGNWSFGDYFKADAIEWAWTLLTDVWGMDPQRLYATYFEGDAEAGLDPDREARDLWLRYLPEQRVLPGSMKDNFWEMGDVGPCGPCSEIHFDGTPDESGRDLVNAGDPRVIEIWNLVFIQFNRGLGSGGRPGKLTPLPAKHVDTGMGLERVTRVLQGKDSNYDIDVFTPIFNAIQKHTGAPPYGGGPETVARASRPGEAEANHAHGQDIRATRSAGSQSGATDGDAVDVAYRVLADHVRCLTVAITDGARPSNEGRGYVLRRILRRGVRIAHQTLKVDGPLLCDLVPAVVGSLGEAFPELTRNPERVADIIRDEELSFLKTLDRGLSLFYDAAVRSFLHAVSKLHADVQVSVTEFGGPEFTLVPSEDYWREMSFGDRTRLEVFGTDRRFGNGSTTKRVFELTAEDYEHLGLEQPQISAADAFKLHDTYGFPIDLTRVMAEERGMSVDLDGYERLMEQAREQSRAGGAGETERRITLPPDAIARLRHLGVEPTDDRGKHHTRPIGADVKAIWNGEDFDNDAQIGRRVAVILDRTNFYAEQGGQVGDTGELTTQYDAGTIPTRGYGSTPAHGGATFHVEDTQVVGGYILHIGRVTDGELSVGDTVQASVDRTRRDPTRANHTATHLLNFALRDVLDSDIEQKGSLVAPDRLRFDFSAREALTPEQLERVEQIVNDLIERDLPVYCAEAPLDTARTIAGVRAVFGERYPDPVRIVAVGAPVDELITDPASDRWQRHAIEFCGGTHLTRTAEAGQFAIIREEALAAGVRRITAVTGVPARAAHSAAENLLQRAEEISHLNDESLIDAFDTLAREADSLTLPAAARNRLQHRLDALREKVKGLQKQAQKGAREQVVAQARQLADAASGPVIVDAVHADADKDVLLAAMDVLRAKQPDAAAMLFTADEAEGKVVIAAAVPKPLIDRGLKAGDWVREAAKIVGGGGGGRPDMAQAGGKDPSKVNDAINAARDFARDRLG